MALLTVLFDSRRGSFSCTRGMVEATIRWMGEPIYRPSILVRGEQCNILAYPSVQASRMREQKASLAEVNRTERGN